jgi:hypothetical protein
MDPNLIDRAITKLTVLPVRQQVQCVLLAARRVQPVAAAWFDQEKLGPALREYVSCLERWLEAKASDQELEKAARPLDRRLNCEIEHERDLPGAMAAHAFLDMEAIALGYSPEMLEEIIRTSVFFSAAASTQSQDVPIEVDTPRLTAGELQFLEQWRLESEGLLPSLRE